MTDALVTLLAEALRTLEGDWVIDGVDIPREQAVVLLAHPPLRDALALGVAWAEAEAALPEGWWLHEINAWSFDDMAYRAEACAAGERDDLSERSRDKPFGTVRYTTGPSIDAFGPTPAAALLALAARLREGRG